MTNDIRKIKSAETRERDVCIVEGCQRPTERFIDGDPSYYCVKHNTAAIDHANASREWMECHVYR